MDLTRVEIFSTGRWNDIKNFTQADLDAMVESFMELTMAGRVPLKFGHNDDQPFTDGQPALGWIQRLWREGETLFADLTSMPRVVYDAVKAGLYKFVSVELLRDVAYDGKEYPWVLSAVALLGADIPAVRGLKDLQALAMSRRAALRSGERVAFTRGVTTTGDRKAMDDKPNLETLSAQVTALAGKVETLSSSNATLKADNDRLVKEAADREKKFKDEKVAAHRTAIKERLDAATRKKVILPRTRELFEMNPAFKSDDGVLGITLDFVDGFIKDNMVPGYKAPAAGSEEGTDTRGGDAAEDGKEPDEVVRMRTNKLLASDQRFKGVSYFVACQHVLREDPELAEKYRSQPGIKGGKAA